MGAMEKEEIRIAAIGGGTGLSTVLRGIKKQYQNITAIVTVSDNGGSSGILRQEMKMLPPGDIRHCILALSNTEPIMERLLRYRFQKGYLQGQSFGNLFLAAMNDITGNFEEAVQNMGKVLAITGQVVPVTSEDVQLWAQLEDGTRITGETEIVSTNTMLQQKIVQVGLTPEHPKPSEAAIDAINDADVILLGPGSLYTSLIPNLLVDGIAEAIRNSKAQKIYISNIMTQPGETEGYTLSEHVRVLEQYLGGEILHTIIANRNAMPPYILQLYKEEGAYPVQNDYTSLRRGFHILESYQAKINREQHYIRHDSDKLAQLIRKAISEYRTRQREKA